MQNLKLPKDSPFPGKNKIKSPCQYSGEFSFYEHAQKTLVFHNEHEKYHKKLQKNFIFAIDFISLKRYTFKHQKRNKNSL